MNATAVMERSEERLVMSPPSNDALRQMIQGIDEKHDDGHARLRRELVELAVRLDQGLQAARAVDTAHEIKLAAIANTPIDATKLVLSTKVIIALIIGCLAVAASVWSLHSNIKEVSASIDAQRTANQTARDMQKLEFDAFKAANDAVTKRQELNQLTMQQDIRKLEEAVVRLSTGRR